MRSGDIDLKSLTAYFVWPGGNRVNKRAVVKTFLQASKYQVFRDTGVLLLFHSRKMF